MLKTFRGGIHPLDGKERSRDEAIETAPLPPSLLVPLSQHIGAPAKTVVAVGDLVTRGQCIAEAAGYVSAAIHAPSSGRVKKLTETTTPLGTRCQAILIDTDGEDRWFEGCNQPRSTTTLDAEAIKKIIASAGIVGMGGASFPTHVKLSPPAGKTIDTVILNGVECEPFLTADYRLMLESPKTIIEGLKLIMRTVSCRRGIIGVEANKPDCIDLLKKTLQTIDPEGLDLTIEMLEVKYPQGAEKQLIFACLNREVPSGGLPMDAGVDVQNVGTASAIFEACAWNRPLTERITTITGPGIERPKNLRVRIGTPVSALLELCRFNEHRTRKLIFGGPMMGLAHFDRELSVNKGMSGILALTDSEVEEYRPCVRCARCIEGCPSGLIPMDLSNIIEGGNFVESLHFQVLDCIECGVCSYVCPARRPIVQWIKLAKSELAKDRMRKAALEKAKESPRA